jgi:hypothetical protein
MTFTKDNLRYCRQYLRDTNKKYPEHLVLVQKEDWGKTERSTGHDIIRVFRSRDFALQVVNQGGHTRLTVNRTSLDSEGEWVDDITWDELMVLKSEAGFGHCWALEVYPPESELVDDANRRHLFLVNEPPAFAWKNTNEHPTVSAPLIQPQGP